MNILPRPPGYIRTAEEVITGIDGLLLKRQRSFLYHLAEILEKKLSDQQNEDMEGVILLLETIADVAHDRYEMDTLFKPGEPSLYDPDDFSELTGHRSKPPDHWEKEA